MKHVKHVGVMLVGCVVLTACPAPVGEELATYEQSGLSSSSVDSVGKGTYQDFLYAILDFESDVSPKNWKTFKTAWDAKESSKEWAYYKVDKPGRVVRDKSGAMVTTGPQTLQDLWKALGIDTYYDPAASTAQQKKTLREMSYKVVNQLGFIGYQYQESDLYLNGYYQYYLNSDFGTAYPEMYVDLPPETWANGVRQVLRPAPAELAGKYTHIVATDVNRWRGTFTGKDGISSPATFKSSLADNIAKVDFKLKHDNMQALFAKQGAPGTPNDYVGTTLFYRELHPPQKPPPGIPNTVHISGTGLLAGAHLRGSQGVYDLLVHHKNDVDEDGTGTLSYVYRFGGYQNPFYKDGKDPVPPTGWDEKTES